MDQWPKQTTLLLRTPISVPNDQAYRSTSRSTTLLYLVAIVDVVEGGLVEDDAGSNKKNGVLVRV
jgi:hypothetical protein